jgi:hypothetical protein
MRMNATLRFILLVLVLSTPAALPAVAAPPQLGLPIACSIGQTCEVQSYMDDDPGPGVKDYRCGSRTYAAHGGVDIRIQSMAAMRAGVPVLAAAAGKVARLRDGVPDISVRGRPPGPIDSQECGNGVVVSHGDGWETQYCHMRRGSVRVKVGDMVKAGDPLGLVGLSGNTEFPHVHITLRQGTTTVDPFAYGAAPGACGGGASLWTPAASAALAYKPRIVFTAGFAGSDVKLGDQVDDGVVTPPTARTPVLIAYVRAIGLQAGDVEALSLTGPDGKVVARTETKPTPRAQAQQFRYVGARTHAPGWPPGIYQADYAVSRDGKVVLEKRFSVRL